MAALEHEGLVERVPDPEDGRAKLIRFTRRGLGPRQARDIVMRVEQTWIEHLGPELAAALREGTAAAAGDHRPLPLRGRRPSPA